MRSMRLSIFAAILITCAADALTAEDSVVLTASGIQVTEQEIGHAINELREFKGGIEGAPPASLVRQLAITLYRSKAMERDALSNNLDKDPEVMSALAEARRQVLANAVLKAAYDEVEVLDMKQAARDYYDSHLKEFISPARIQAAHIVLMLDCDCVSCDCLAQRAEKAKKAKEIINRLKSGESFTQLAKDFSEEKETASRGGLIGAWITQDDVDKKFATAAFALKKGEVSDVVETKYGFHIIRVEERTEKEQIPFDQVEDALVDRLSKEYQKRMVGKVVEKYNQQAESGKWDDSALKRLGEDKGSTGGSPAATGTDSQGGATRSTSPPE